MSDLGHEIKDEEAKEGYLPHNHDKYKKATEGVPLDELGEGVPAQEYFLLLTLSNLLNFTADLPSALSEPVDVLLLVLLDHLNYVVFQPQCFDPDTVITHRRPLLQTFSETELTELRQVGLVVTEAAKELEAVQGGLDLEFEARS